MVAESDVQVLKNILLSLGELQPKNQNIQYKTKQFLEFKVDGVDIDVMAGFVIVNKDRDFYFPIDKDDIVHYTKIKLKEQKTMPWESKLGGDPYLEIGMEYPKASNGEYFRLLA